MLSHWEEEEEQDTAQPLTALGRKAMHRSHYSSIRSVSASSYSRAESSSHHSVGSGLHGGGGSSMQYSSNSGSRPGTGASTVRNQRPIPAPDPIITISAASTTHSTSDHDAHHISDASALDDQDDDYVTVEHPAESEPNQVVPRDKASRVLGIKHRKSMEPIPASAHRTSVASVRSAPTAESTPTSSGPTLPLASLYVVSGLPKSPHTWTLADPDSVAGVHHSDGAVGRWWRPEVLGSTVSPGAGGGGGKKKRKGKTDDGSMFSSSGHLSKQEVGKMLSKALKVRTHAGSVVLGHLD